MAGKKDDVVNLLVQKFAEQGLGDATKKQVSAIIDLVLESIVEVATDQESVRTCIGTFSLKERASREAHNPRTGEKVQVEAYRTIGFKASSALRSRAADAVIEKEAAAQAAKVAPKKVLAKKK